MKIRPFAAVRPAPEFAAQVAAVPYDVVDTVEARALAAGNPKSFLHVSRPEIDMPDGTDCSSPEAYAQARKALDALRADGTKEYLLFHTYDICMAWLGSDELCSGPERCYHK